MTSENPVVEVRSGEEFNLDAVDSILKNVIPGLSGKAILSQYNSGASNLTYALDYPKRTNGFKTSPFWRQTKVGP